MPNYILRRAGVLLAAASIVGTTIAIAIPPQEAAAAPKKICIESTRRTGAIVHGTYSKSSPATPTGRAVVAQPGAGKKCGTIDAKNCTVYVPPHTSMTWRQVIPVLPDQHGYYNNTGGKGYEKLLEKGSDCSLGFFRITFVGV